MKVLAVIAVITLCLVQIQHSKSGSCNSKFNQTALLTEVKSTLNVLIKKSKEMLIDPMIKGKNQSSVKINPSCNITKETKIEQNNITRRQIYKKFYYGIQIFLVTAKNFSKLPNKNISTEVLKNETNAYKEIYHQLRLVRIELRDCLSKLKFSNQTKKIDLLKKKTIKKALTFSQDCFQIHDITYQKNHNNIIYYRQLRKFLKIGIKKLKTLDPKCRKKTYKDDQAGKSRKTQEDIRTKEVINERH